MLYITFSDVMKFSRLFIAFFAEYKKGRNHLDNLRDYLKKEHIKYNNFYVTRPTLNDVFLELTGKELRD